MKRAKKKKKKKKKKENGKERGNLFIGNNLISNNFVAVMKNTNEYNNSASAKSFRYSEIVVRVSVIGMN